MMKILNLTQNAATVEQIAAGVVEPKDKEKAQYFLTFDTLPSRTLLRVCAVALAGMARSERCKTAMIGGAPYFMAPLEKALVECGIRPVYAFSKRESVDEKQADGSVKKIQVFRHVGFVHSVARLPTKRKAS